MEYLKCDLCNASAHELNALSCKHASCNNCFYKLCLFNKKIIEEFTYEKEKELDLKCLLCESGTLKISKFVISQKLNDISEKVKGKENKKCLSHNKKLNVFCLECKIQMCDDCFSSHKILPMWSSHKKGENPIQSTPLLKINCSLHENKPFHYLCENCNSTLCEVCKKSHNKEHKIRSLQDFFNEKKEEFASHFQLPPYSAKETSAKLEESDLELKEKINKEYANLKGKIHSIIDYLNEICVELDKELAIIYEEIDINQVINKTMFENLITDYENVSKSTEFDITSLYMDKIPKNNCLSIGRLHNDTITETLNELKTSIDKYHSKTNNKLIMQINNSLKGVLSTENFITITESNSHLENNNLLSLIHSLNGHTASVKKLIQLKDGKVASCSYDKTFKIWDPLDDYKCTNTPSDNYDSTNDIIQLQDGRIATCSEDKTIRIWDPINDFNCTHTLTGHSGSVVVLLRLLDGRIASGSSDKTIRIWDPKDNFKCTHTLTGHTSLITILTLLKDGRIVSGSSDKKIRIWNTNDNFKMTPTLTGRTDLVTSLMQLQDNLIVTGSDDGSIRIWNIDNTFNCVHTLAGHNKSVCGLLKLHDGRLASCSEDNNIRIWNHMDNFKCIHNLSGNSNLLNSVIQLKDGKIAHGSSDEVIRIWD